MDKHIEFLDQHIREIPDFPSSGILFRDITPLLSNPRAFKEAINQLTSFSSPALSAVAGIEARGFIFGIAVADRLNLPFVPIRKQGKLPGQVLSASYQLEYGTDTVCIHADALTEGQQVFLVDDLIATGGTLCAAAEVIEKTRAIVAQTACLIELKDLGGREKYNRPLQSILVY